MFAKVLVANRGEIACRVLRTLRRLNVASVAVYSEADKQSLHVSAADEAVCIGPAPAARSYLDVSAIVLAAERSGAQAIHPGYGFLSENAEFAEACAARGLRFIGPSPAQIRAFGLKHRARELALQNGLPLLPGTALLESAAQARSQARAIGYPVMLKSTAGGGGIGLAVCRDEERLEELFESVTRSSRSAFGDAGAYLEKFVERARHLEVQIFGDGRGQVISLGVRDCSVQRRNQKVLEEAPAPGLSPQLEAELVEAAVRLGRAVAYESAGTVELLFDVDSQCWYFLEVNTRLQVEHGVTEAITGVDLVEWMVRQAAGELGDLEALVPRARGHAVEVRLVAENPGKGFQPSAGLLTEVTFPDRARVDTWLERGTEITPYYDALLAKLIVHGESREQALGTLREALAETRLGGIETNLSYLRALVESTELVSGTATTSLLSTYAVPSRGVEVIRAGTQSTIQDYPGRLGYWAVGIPPSGPMDHLALRLGNRLLGNPEGAAALEMTVTGATLRFHEPALVSLAGADMQAKLDGRPVPRWAPFEVEPGQLLELGHVKGPGLRCYLCVAGGFSVPRYLGSSSTFVLGGFGGHAGRALRVGDILHVAPIDARPGGLVELPAALVPEYSHAWRIGVLYGPHGAPDFFTARDIDTFFSTDWEVHYNSARTGVRLVGPKPEWARPDGGEAGLHPSNIHDTAYAVGTVDFTGDMPIILGPDGPSLGGFVCPATIVQSELWKIGQLKPGDRVRFVPVSEAAARHAELDQERALRELAAGAPLDFPRPSPLGSAVLRELPRAPGRVEVVYRRSGDRHVLVEYGPMVLDLELRFRVHALMCRLESEAVAGIIELTPGIRSLQVHFDPHTISVDRLIERLARLEDELEPVEGMQVPTRVVHLPLSWNDEAAALAVQKYGQLVRKDAPWCPSNIEFIRRINGLDSIDHVRDIVFGASYLVLGLGDVYLGAPVATPVDPRHRLVTTKYNPARTWTPENAVGIGGAYLCVYGMEGPGGYQLVGRTLQMYNRFRTTPYFEADKPWLLRFFDQIRFYPVGGPELLELREDFLLGRTELRIEHETFRLRDYRRFLDENRASIADFKARQQAAFEAERRRWAEDAEVGGTETEAVAPDGAGATPHPDGHGVPCPVPGSVWKIRVTAGDRVAEGDTLVVVESMKMEIAVNAPCAGRITSVMCAEGRAVAAGQTLLVVEP